GGRLIRSHHHGWYLHNVRGDVVHRADDAGNLRHNYRFSAFGIERNPDANNTNPFRFAGELWDWAIGEYYLRARTFSPRLGRFTQHDPHWTTANMIFGDSPTLRNDRYMPSVHAIMQSSNLYLYAIHNPIFWNDPSGYSIVAAITAAAAAAFGWFMKKDSGSGSTGSPSGTSAPRATGQSAASTQATANASATGTTAASAKAPTFVDTARAVAAHNATIKKPSAGTTTQPLTAHTVAPANPWGSTNNLINSASAQGQGGVTPIGRAFQKHSGRQVTSFQGQVSGNAASNTQQGMAHLNHILNNPSSTFVVSNHSVYGQVLKVRLLCGKGAMWSADGTRFIQLLEQYTRTP
ncbi:MAG: RHS repeat-associated core domain-containing protein, partial [Defluviitaleaceae bacterium]|nr:RHS repeat-associated core domain-containing protein [Defluviitaleaceae bacterium]